MKKPLTRAICFDKILSCLKHSEIKRRRHFKMIKEIIRLAPWVRDCTNCGLHGRVVHADGSESEEFASKETALRYVDEQKNLKVFTSEECDTLKWMILATNWMDAESSQEMIEDMIKVLEILIPHDDDPSEMLRLGPFTKGNETGH